MARHVRKHRRLNSARLRTGKQIVRHRCLSGRTGSAHSKKLQTLIASEIDVGEDENE